ncbi:MAG: PQQ-like beta-propeller repeat protein [Candidatus Bathyarchaeota archaeon]
MKKLEIKTKIATIALILVLTISAIIVALPATAQEPPTKETYAFIGAVPNPVGVNQQVLLHVGITDMLGNVAYGWENLTVTIERPNDTTETLTNIRTDATGGTGRVYTPTMVGTYYLQTHFPEQVNPISSRNAPAGAVMLASDSEKLKLIVQDESIPYYPGHSLPTEYWIRPIDAQLREWSTIASSWLYIPRNKFTPYNDGPETAHILWVEPLTIGGIAGGALGTPDLEALGYHGFECGDAYEGKWGGRGWGWGTAGPMILAGRLYYMDTPLGFGAPVHPIVYHCVDLHTGEELWTKTFLDNRTTAFGQLFYWDSYNYHGVFGYLWITIGSTWHAFDAYSGDWRFTIENVPSGTTRWGSKGEIYRLQVDQTNGWMALWNMSALGSMEGNWGSEVHLKTLDAAANTTAAERAWSLNVTIPTGLTGRVGEIYFGDRIISVSASTTEVSSWGLSLKPEQEGTLLFENTWQAPAEWAAGNVTINVVNYSPHGEDGVFVVFARELREYYGFSMNTGKYLWGPTDPEHYLNTYVGTESTIAYGVFISCGVSGITTAYNATTGEFLWEYHAVDPYQEILWANSWWTKPWIVTDGKIYLSHLEHSSIDPKPRGAPFICLDMENGDEIWRADGLFRQTYWGSNAIIGDSIIATMDVYDQRVYAIGKGPSVITVETPMAAITKGSSITIQGTVTDVSPGTEDPALQLRFPNGLPAIADEDMSEWMIYVYKNFERPADATGVTVKLEVVTPSMEYKDLGTTTSDSYGNYGLAFEPDTAGTYMIIATFTGSGAYYGSTQTSYLTVADPIPVDVDMSGLEESVSDVESSVSNLTTYILAILVLVIIALLVAVYSLLKSK